MRQATLLTPAEAEARRLRSENEALTQLLEVQEQTIGEQAAKLDEALKAAEAYGIELKRSNGELEHFAYIASHDLQEPLRMVSSYTQLLGRRYASAIDDDGREFIAFAVNGAKRMQALLDGLLQYSRAGTKGDDPTSVDLGRTLAEVSEDLALAIAEAGATVTHGELPTVVADGSQMRQLLQNLIANGLKYRGPEPPRIDVACRAGDGEWIISVRDNGMGIAPHHHERIFLIFQRLHRPDEIAGTGVGLAVCKRIVERHGGRIWVESSAGQGATFFFTLPVTDRKERP